MESMIVNLFVRRMTIFAIKNIKPNTCDRRSPATPCWQQEQRCVARTSLAGKYLRLR